MRNIIFNKSADYVSDQISLYQELVTVGKIVARPIYSKDVLLNAYTDSTNKGCINVKASVTCGLGYTWIDNENAKACGAEDFNNGLYGKDGSPKPFTKLIKEWLIDKGVFGESRLEICRIGKTPENLLVLSGKNTLISLDRKSIWQFDRQRNKAVEFKRYGQYTKTAHDTLCITNTSPEDDYYGVPCYVSALGSIRENQKIVEANLEVIENMIDPSLMVIVSNHAMSESEFDKFEEGLRSLKTNRGSAAILNLNSKDAVINVQNYGSKPTDGNYIEERKAIVSEIIALHGLTPELYGVLSTGGISSGEKATGALKIFLQTVIRPEKEELEKLLNEFYRNEFPGFNKDNGIVFNSIDLTDSSEDSTTNLTDVQTVQAYVTLGSLFLYNEYRKAKNQTEINDKEWADLLAGGTGLGFNINKQNIYKD